MIICEEADKRSTYPTRIARRFELFRAKYLHYEQICYANWFAFSCTVWPVQCTLFFRSLRSAAGFCIITSRLRRSHYTHAGSRAPLPINPLNGVVCAREHTHTYTRIATYTFAHQHTRCNIQVAENFSGVSHVLIHLLSREGKMPRSSLRGEISWNSRLYFGDILAFVIAKTDKSSRGKRNRQKDESH